MRSSEVIPQSMAIGDTSNYYIGALDQLEC